MLFLSLGWSRPVTGKPNNLSSSLGGCNSCHSSDKCHGIACLICSFPASVNFTSSTVGGGGVQGGEREGAAVSSYVVRERQRDLQV
ncbi:hypothetical protein OIU84_003673 [Salix udensis]|uniref:Uncharacterized protein n=1 Tax=Salix udensis TaxID=889485 RepID=A0AAD6K0K0_9ROSI|nr:hypothetical protein OIU84_003673 [Salix udensis]